MSEPTSANPYQAPSVIDGPAAQRMEFPDIPTKALKTLRNDSHTIRTVAFLAVLGMLFMLVVIFLAPTRSDQIRFQLLIMGLLAGWNLVLAIGLISRASWGRIVGFVGGAIMLVGFPIGTLIGVLFLISLARAKPLFGPGRFQHRALEAEWKYRKKNKVD